MHLKRATRDTWRPILSGEYFAHEMKKGLNSVLYRQQHKRFYFVRMQIAIICTLLFFIALFRYWPESEELDRSLAGRFEEERVLDRDFLETIGEVTIDRSAPPVPRPETTLPEDVVVDMEYDLELNVGEGEGVRLAPFVDERTEPELVEDPDHPPRVRRITEPVMPTAARQADVYVEIEVLFTISQEGEVIEASIYEMRLLNRSTGEMEQVSQTGYGFRDRVLRAAREWEFHPARHEGQPVRSTTRRSFQFGTR